MSATANAVDWLERAPRELAKFIDGPEHVRRISVAVDHKGVQVDVRWDVGIGRSLACRSGKTLVDAVRAVQESLREKDMSF